MLIKYLAKTDSLSYTSLLHIYSIKLHLFTSCSYYLLKQVWWSKPLGKGSTWLAKVLNMQSSSVKYAHYFGVWGRGPQENFEFYQLQDSILGYFMCKYR